MIRFPLAAAGPGTWRPHKDPRHPFEFTCPRCGTVHRAWHMRRVTPEGRVTTPIACDTAGCGWADDEIHLAGWDPATHGKPELPFVLPAHRDMRHYCGHVSDIGQENAEAFARDPRIARGHWCAKCRRYGWNHEWRWVKDGKVVGGGQIGPRFYWELSPAQRRGLETHFQVPEEIGAK